MWSLSYHHITNNKHEDNNFLKLADGAMTKIVIESNIRWNPILLSLRFLENTIVSQIPILIFLFVRVLYFVIWLRKETFILNNLFIKQQLDTLNTT